MPNSRDTRPEDFSVKYPIASAPPSSLPPPRMVLSPIALSVSIISSVVVGMLAGAYLVYQQNLNTNRTTEFAALVAQLRQQQSQLSDALAAATERAAAAEQAVATAEADLRLANKNLASLVREQQVDQATIDEYAAIVRRFANRCQTKGDSTQTAICTQTLRDLANAGLSVSSSAKRQTTSRP